MPEIKTKVDTFMMDFVCEKCNVGRLLLLPNLPPKPGIKEGDRLFAHICSNKECKTITPIKNARYPFPVYELPKPIENKA